MKTLIFKNSIINIDKISEIYISNDTLDFDYKYIVIVTDYNDKIKKEYNFKYKGYSYKVDLDDLLKYLNENILHSDFKTVDFEMLMKYYLDNVRGGQK